jgi:hypothetical protein
VSSDVHAVRPRYRALLLIQERASEIIRISKILEQPRLPPEIRNVDLAGVSVGELQPQAPVIRNGDTSVPR